MIATGIALAGYSYLLAVQRGPVRMAEGVEVDSAPAPLAVPLRLSALRDHATPVAASGQRPLIAATELTIVVTGVPEHWRPRVGIATFAAVTGGDFVWTPLAEGEAQPDGSVVVRPVVPSQADLSITLAAGAELARHAYLAKESLTISARRDANNQTVTIAAELADVSFELPTQTASAAARGPWRLVRVDDERWLPQQFASTGLFLTTGEPTLLLLGQGHYQLQDPLDPSRHLPFEVPRQTRVALTPELAAPRVAPR